MEPRIQYAKTKDGVSIAYAVTGEGPPLVICPFSWEQFTLSQQVPSLQTMIERLRKGRLLVQYDSRGTGLSERNVKDLSLEARLHDLEAVVRAAGIHRFALYGTLMSGVVAIAYAAHHQRQVRQLILYGTYGNGANVMPWERIGPLIELCRNNWDLASQVFADMGIREQQPDVGVQLSEALKASCSGEVAAETLAQGYEIDVSYLLPRVKAATLVIHRRGDPIVSFALGQKLAAGIPKARLVPLEGTIYAPFLGDSEAVVGAIDEFLGEGEEAEAKTELPEGMAVILFADIVDSTSLTEQLGDAAFRAKARELDASLRTIIGESGGTPVEGKVLGDGVLAVFTSARQAIGYALRCNAAGESVGLQLHLGIHAGDVIREGNNVYGGAVNIAARIATASAPGEVLVSDTVRGLARTSAGVSFDDRGEHELKGVADPQRLFAVRGDDGG
ncbi:MAG: adenylate/guanylate cyclase domain-containing protein [Chloroflexi bacterium]|nr:adenylate/guanylate cyclase domain-containing protein [Chloroflexota bacterium]